MQRFLDKIKKTNKCWIWIGAKRTNFGYGAFGFLGKTMSAHRVSYYLFVGAIPHGKIVCHKCDNPQCVRPSHLFLGTHKTNIDDCISKNRYVLPPSIFKAGEEHRLSKLTVKKVKEIRKKYPANSLRTIAKQYNIDHSAVWQIVNKKRWQSVI